MERRLVLFMILAVGILVINQIIFAPKHPPQKAVEPPAGAAAEEPGEGEQPAPEADDTEQPVEPEAETVPVPPVAVEAEEEETDEEYLTLGSVDPESPYRMLITLTNHGAGIKRLELADPKYRDLHDRSGYLGHLELQEDEETGLLVRVVGAGTPAAAAGIEVGDRITAAGVEELELVGTNEDLRKVLLKTKPRQELKIDLRGPDGESKRVIASLHRRPLEVIRPEAENVVMRGAELPNVEFDVPSFLMTLERVGGISVSGLQKEHRPKVESLREELDSKVSNDLWLRIQKELEAEEVQELPGVRLRDVNWRVAERDGSSVTFERNLPELGLVVSKHYELAPIDPDVPEADRHTGYDLQLKVSVRNASAGPLEVAYRLDGPSGLPVEGWWYARKSGRSWGAMGLRDVVARFEGGDPVQISPTEIADAEAETMEGRPLAYAGVDAQYFAAVLIPDKVRLEDQWLEKVETTLIGPVPKYKSGDGTYSNVTCQLVSRSETLEPGRSLDHRYTVFAGPKKPDLVSRYAPAGQPAYSLNDLIYYGWFSPVARLMVVVLHFFYGFVGNYGLAIILLTVVVRGSMFPLSRKQTLSMIRMQQLKPQMDEIKAKYKDDMQKQSSEMQELYRKHGINPLAGCMPMVIQLPIFIGLYRSLWVDVELRQAPLISESIRWCSNLAAPDMLLNWSSVMPDFITSGQGFFGLGPYLNILPLATIVLFLLQQKMTMPPPANEQAEMQQKMMKYMMVVMGLLFFKVASGLCLYFIASSMWGVAERKMLPRPAMAAAGGGQATAPPPQRNGKPKSKQKPKAKKRK